jgi:hypothetical protein
MLNEAASIPATPTIPNPTSLPNRSNSARGIGAEPIKALAEMRRHVARVLSKLGLRDRVQAVVLVYETGVVSRGQAEPQ